MLRASVEEDLPLDTALTRLAEQVQQATALKIHLSLEDCPEHLDLPQQQALYRLKAERFTDHALLGWARSQASAHDAAWRDLATLPQRWTPPVFPLKAADFMARGVEKGPAIGAAMAAAEKAWLEAGFPADKVALDKIAGDAAHR